MRYRKPGGRCVFSCSLRSLFAVFCVIGITLGTVKWWVTNILEDERKKRVAVSVLANVGATVVFSGESTPVSRYLLRWSVNGTPNSLEHLPLSEMDTGKWLHLENLSSLESISVIPNLSPEKIYQRWGLSHEPKYFRRIAGSEIRYLQCLPKLKALRMECISLDSMSMKELCALPALSRLTLHMCHLDSDALKALRSDTKLALSLDYVIVSDNVVKDKLSQHLVSVWPPFRVY